MNDNVSSTQAVQTWRISILASNPWNDTGIDLSAGGVYDFVATGEWKDASIPSDADGYVSTPIVKLFERFRRIPDARYFKLIGTIGKSTGASVEIGVKLTGFTPAKSDRLYCFANDVRWMYWNNRGAIELTVTKRK
jgi:hypothetical protein